MAVLYSCGDIRRETVGVAGGLVWLTACVCTFSTFSTVEGRTYGCDGLWLEPMVAAGSIERCEARPGDCRSSSGRNGWQIMVAAASKKEQQGPLRDFGDSSYKDQEQYIAF